MMNRITRRYFKKNVRLSIYFCIISTFLFIIIFLSLLQSQLNYLDDKNKDERDYCNQELIQKYYMFDQSPQKLLKQKPVRPSFVYKLPNANFCSPVDPSPQVLIFVISKSSNFGARNAIRRTWGNFNYLKSVEKFSHLRLKLLFLLDIDENHLLKIQLEQSIYHDLIQVYLPEHYILSTYRDMAILHWTETYCSQVSLTLKTDDDIFLNIYLLGKILNDIFKNLTNHLSPIECEYLIDHDASAAIYGAKIFKGQVVRDLDDAAIEGPRYIITNDEYPCKYYPEYMSGFGYITTRSARLKLLCVFFRNEKSFHLSDVFITGVLPEYMNISRRSLRVKISSQGENDCDLFFNQYNAYACASSLHYKNRQATLMTDLHIFERYNVYWKRVYTNRFFYIN